MKDTQALKQDVTLLLTAQTKALDLLDSHDTYLVRHAERILKAAKQLELLVKDLESAYQIS
jgi:hypothetical protein